MKKRVLSLFLAFAMVVCVIPKLPNQVEASTTFIVSNPYEQVNWNTFRQYKYSHHTHTSNSDGNSSTRTVAEDHFRLGYHILAFTDHDFTHVTPNQVRSGNPVSMRRIAEMQANTGTSSELRGIGTEANGQGMIFLPNTNERSGLRFPEIDAVGPNPSDPPSTHVNTFFSSLPRASGESVQALGARLAAEGTGFAILNHPGRTTGSEHETSRRRAHEIANNPRIFTPVAELFLNNPYYLGMEIINKFDTETQAERILWDNILQITMPQGKPVWGYSGDDSHHSRAIGHAYNLMLMPQLTLSELRHAKETGAFFGFSRVDRQYEIFPARIENWHWSGVDMSSSQVAEVLALPTPSINSINVAGDTITINATGHQFINWYADGNLIHTGAALDLNLHSASINSYVRATVGHRGQGVLYTQPFGIQRAGQERALPTLTSVTQPRAVTVPWGNQSEMGFGLPANVPIVTSAGTRPATVLWSLTNTGYNPAIRDRDQTFTVTGTVRLHGVRNPANVSLNVSIRVTMQAIICTDCSPRAVLVWAPGFTAGENPNRYGIQLAAPDNSTLVIANNPDSGVTGLHLTATSGTFRPLRIHSAPVFSGWNTDTGFVASPNAEYRAVFNVSTSRVTSQGSIRIQNRVGSDTALTSVNVDNLSPTPTSVRHEWRQEGQESFNIDTRNTSERVVLMIEGMRIYKLFRCNGNCDSSDRFNKCGCADCAGGVVIPPVTTAPTVTTTPPPPTTTTPAIVTTAPIITTATTPTGVQTTSASTAVNTTGAVTSAGVTSTSTFRADITTAANPGTTVAVSNETTSASSPSGTATTVQTGVTTTGGTVTTTAGTVTTGVTPITSTPATVNTTTNSATVTGTVTTATTSSQSPHTTGESTETSETTEFPEETTPDVTSVTTDGTTESPPYTTASTTHATDNTPHTSYATTTPPITTTAYNGGETSDTSDTAETTEPVQERKLGDITGNNRVTISDALEILKYLAKLQDSVLFTDPAAIQFALIKGTPLPTINDALEILKFLAKLPSDLDIIWKSEGDGDV
jgi:hypothetical protein